MADMVTVQELENAKIDARTIGESVNENKIVTPRYGAPFKSMPMIAEEMQSVIGTIIAGGVPASIVLDGNQTQDEINLYGGKKYNVPVSGYPVGAKVLLNDNVTEVVNTVAGNTANPNLDMTGWVLKPTSDSAVVLENGHTQMFKNNQIQSAIDKGADDTGNVDSTAALISLLEPTGKYVIQMTKGDYLTDGFDIPSNTIAYMNGAKFKRKTYSGKPIINVGENSIVIGAIIDGNKDALGNAGAIADQGISLQSGAVALFCESNNNRSHGITARIGTTLTMSDNQKILFCETSNNGFNAGASGTADGINVLNSNNALVFGCESYNNARTGFVAETYNGNLVPEDKHDITFSTGVKFKSCKSWGNGYNDFNAEMTTSPIFEDVTGDVLTFRGSLRAQILNVNVGQIYGETADFAKVAIANIKNNTKSNNLLTITGKSPKVSGVDIEVGASVTLSGNTVEIYDTTGFNGEVSDISVNRCFNGIMLRVANTRGLRVDSATNVKYRITRAEGTVETQTLKFLNDKKLEIYGSAIPTVGAWNKNDIVWNTFFSATAKTMCWICTTSGVFGTTPPVFEAVSIMSNASNVNQNTISLSGAATLADVIAAVNSLATSDNGVKTSLKNAGIMRSS